MNYKQFFLSFFLFLFLLIPLSFIHSDTGSSSVTIPGSYTGGTVTVTVEGQDANGGLITGTINMNLTPAPAMSATITSTPACTAPCNVVVSWTSSNIPNVIKIYKNGLSYWTQTANVPGSVTDWTQPAGTYTYCVRGVNNDWTETGDLACSTTVVATPISVTLTANPTSMTLPTNTSRLTWTTTGSPTSCTGSGDWSGSKAVGGGFQDMTGLVANTYNYTITCTKLGAADAVATVSVLVNPGIPATPTGLSVVQNTTPNSCGSDWLDVTWSASSGATSYSLYRDGGATAIYTGPSTSYSDTGLALSSTHSYKVKATNSAGSSAQSSSVSGTVAGPCAGIPIINSPTATSITSTSATLGGTITSNGGSAITSRGTCWATTANPTTNCSPEGGTSVSAFSHNRTGLISGVLYHYRAYATNSVGTGYTTDATFTTLSTPPNLTASSITPVTATINVPLTFSSTITNNGGSSTGSSFNNLFQVATAANGGGTVSVISTNSLSAVSAGSVGVTTSSSYTFVSTGTYSVRACADSNASFVGSIPESNEGDNCGAWTTVTVSSSASQANLTASAVTPVTATVSVPLTFSSTITNSGGSSTGAGFNNFFQVATAANGGGTVSSISVNPIGILNAGSSGSVTSSSYTFPSAGTYSVRACADSNASFVGSIPESNEGDNCGAWTTVTVSSSLACITTDVGTNTMKSCVWDWSSIASSPAASLSFTSPGVTLLGTGDTLPVTPLSSPAPVSGTIFDKDYGAIGPISGHDNYFMVRWKGKFNFRNGSYIFTGSADDGIRVFIDDDNDDVPDSGYIIDQWNFQGYTSFNSASMLLSGIHQIDLEYMDQGGGSRATLSYSGILAPTVALELPSSGASVSGTIQVKGYAIPSNGTTMKKVELWTASVPGLTASSDPADTTNYVAGFYPLSRVDLASTYGPGGTSPKNAYPNIGFNYPNLDTTLLGNGSHSIIIKAYDNAGNLTTLTTPITVVSPPIPPAPTGFWAGPSTCGTGQINTSWNASSGATSYTLKRDGTTIYTGSELLFSDTGLANSSSHTYTLTASNSSGTSASVGTVPAVTVAPPSCSAPVTTFTATPLTMTLPTNSTVLDWSATNNPTSCTSSSNPVNASWNGVKAVSGSQTISGLSAGTYIYNLYCTNAIGNSSNVSRTVTVNSVALPTVALTTPTSPVAVPSNIDLTWTVANSVSCSANGAPGWVGAKSIAGGTQTVAITATTNYAITCLNSIGQSATSNLTVIGVPTNSTVTVIPSIGGEVTSTDGIISCPAGAVCSHIYSNGSYVALNAIPTSSNWKFVGWIAPPSVCSGAGLCDFHVGGPDITVQAIFAPRPVNYEEF